MKRSLLKLAALMTLSACATMPDDAAVLTGSNLTDALSGQRLALAPPEDSGFNPDLILIADLRADGVAVMTAQMDGARVDLFDSEERWQVRGQRLCVYEGASPDEADCIRVDWIGAGRIQITETGENGAQRTGIGTLTPL